MGWGASAGRVLGQAHLMQVQKALQEGSSWGLMLGRAGSDPPSSVLKGSEFPVRAGMQAKLSRVMEMEAQRPNTWDCVTVKLVKMDFCSAS